MPDAPLQGTVVLPLGMRVLALLLCVASALRAQSVQELVTVGDARRALGETQKARQELKRGLALPSTDKDDDDNKQRARATLSRLN